MSAPSTATAALNVFKLKRDQLIDHVVAMAADELARREALSASYVAAEKSFAEFVKQAWHVIEPGREFVRNWHIDAIAEHLEAISLGQIKRLIINIPPRCMKSILVSVMWPCWEWIKLPGLRYLFTSYSSSLSVKHSVDRRDIIVSPWYAQRWNRYALTEDQNTKQEFKNSLRGVMVATSVGGTATGKGGDRIVIDDPHNPKQAASEAERENALHYIDRTLSTRLDNPKTGAMVLIMQRLHERDATGHLLAQGGWEHLCLPMEAPSKRTVVTLPLSKTEVVREPDALLWPERFPRPVVDALKISLGSYGAAGQLQQNPAPAEGGIVKRPWWKTYSKLPEKIDFVVHSWDMAFKDTAESSYVVGQVVARSGPDYYLLAQVRRRMAFTESCAAVKALLLKYPAPNAVLVEDKANGSAIIEVLRKQVPGIIPIEPKGGKLARANAVSPLIESGNVYLPDPVIDLWVEDFIAEWAMVPNNEDWDQVDAFSQALNWMRERGDLGAFNMVSLTGASAWRR